MDCSSNSAISSEDSDEKKCTTLRLVNQRIELESMVSTTREADSMLQQLLNNIKRVLTLTDGVSTDTACDVVECLKRAYTYVHTVSKDKFKLEDCTIKALDKFDATFKKYLEYRLEEKEHQASEELDSCEQLSEEAVREARRDYDKIKEREQEESQMSLRELEDIRCDAEEMISDARESLTLDKDNLISVAEGIDELLVNLKEASERSDRQYWEMQDELRAEGFTNLCRQERLAEKRFWLKKREMEVTSNVLESSVKDMEEQELSSNDEQVTEQLDELVKNLKIVTATALGEDYYHSQADQLYDELVEGFSEKREDLNTQCEQAETSLLILEIMNECVQLVMEDAKKWKNEWEQQLPVMKLTNLLQLRDALMATACVHMMRLETSSEKDTEQQQRQEQTQLKGKVKLLQDELEVTDQQITALNPLLHLDTLRQRFKKLQRDVSLVLEKKDISAAEFSSRGTYVELVKRRTGRGVIKKTDKQGCERGRVTKNRKRQRERSVPTKRGLRQRIPCPSISRQSTRCQKTYSTRSSLNQHKSVHTVDKQQRSIDNGGKQIGKKTRSGAQKQVTRSRRRQVNKKLATHTLDQCSFCQKKFSRPSYLQRHLLTHTGEKPFKCETCQLGFSQCGSLHQHILTHTGEKPHQCTVCLKSFSRLSSLRRHSIVHPELHHSLIHSGKKIHECHYCHKKFAYASQLRQHLITHTGEKPFSCIHCSKSFNQHYNLLRHINNCHNKDKQSM